ncbi:probable cytochrome P450 6a17 [Ceratina calcarata]|uniref:Probable cytochrome P450 6a17 n=1 Tax=Ceratina calcarata TaxID=156304 RepID=A0AAJ7S921_9HYME|nr:probable cytochrome P450 6a17 [Ceratina calcarata]XP_026673601.1 probable cytochrome P450 6a17 [Ceratina calcarata]
MINYFEILSLIIAASLAMYYYFTCTFNFWQNRQVPGPKPILFFGNVKDIMLRRRTLGNYVTELYFNYKDIPMFGLFIRKSPHLVVRDMDLIKDVLIKDFSVFDNRGIFIPQRADPLAANIFNLESSKWRPLRARISPVFTSGKLKEMFPLILECAEQLEEYLERIVGKGEPIECCEIAARFTTDVIGSCAFGINMKALSDEKSVFRRIGRQIFEHDSKTILRFMFREIAPELYNLFGYVLPYTEATKFVTKVISDTMKYRKKNGIVRPDFINMLMELKKHPDTLKNIELTDTLLAAQAFLFFAAGFETSSITIGHALYEMALNLDIQEKLRIELKQFSKRNNKNFQYEDIKEMKYLNKVFKETLRKYPVGTTLIRKSTSDYTFNGTKVTIPKGTRILIPTYAIQHDPDIYPNPEKFDPERFNEEEIASRHSMSYLPFGDGPRNCIAARFAIYQTKVGIIKMLENFRLEVCEKTMIPYINNPTSLILSPKDGLYLKISKVES